MERKRDYFFCMFFLSHIPITVLFDLQLVAPRWLFQKELLDVVENYVNTYRDPMVGGRPYWFISLCLSEIILQLPFFFVASYVYLIGVSKNRWIRLPMILYSSHVITTMLPIFVHLFYDDFSNQDFLGPRNFQERLTLSMFYFPYLLVPVLLLTDALFSSVYQQKIRFSSENGSELKRKQH